MSNQVKDHVAIKLFIGALLTSELKMILSQSSEWQHDKLTPNQENLSIVRFQDKEYVGLSAHNDQISIKELGEKEAQLRTMLLKYCSEYDLDSLKYFVFPRVFIS